MPAYKCKIATGNGGIIERVMVADSISLIRQQVKQDGNFLIYAGKSGGPGTFFSFKGSGKIKTKAFYSFNQEFAVLLKAGVPVVSAFDGILEKQEKNALASVLKDIRDDISAGESVSGAFGKYTNIFSPLYVASIRAGETGGDIPGAISGYIEYLKRSEEIKQKIKAASIYPAILSVCSICVVVFLIVFVVPSITGSFIETGTELPLLTKMLLNTSDFIKSFYLPLFLFTASLGTFFFFFRKSANGRFFLDKHFLKVPLFGELALCYGVVRFSSTLSTVLASGTTLNDAIKLSEALVSNTYIKNRIATASQALERGRSFAQSLSDAAVFPGMVVRMIAAGEEGGSLESVLKDIAEFYERDVEARLTMMTSSIEPMLMLIMGVLIGFIVLAMYMPIFQMAATIG